jgi:hypothetical protein
MYIFSINFIYIYRMKKKSNRKALINPKSYRLIITSKQRMTTKQKIQKQEKLQKHLYVKTDHLIQLFILSNRLWNMSMRQKWKKHIEKV